MFPWWPSTKIVQSSNHDLSKNMAASGWGLFSLYTYLYRKLKNLLVRNQWTDFNITWQECFFGDPLPRLFKLSWSSKNMATTGQGLFFSICLYKKLQKSSPKKPLDQAQCSFARMLLLWPSTRMVQAFMICQKTWPPWGGAYFRYISV